MSKSQVLAFRVVSSLHIEWKAEAGNRMCSMCDRNEHPFLNMCLGQLVSIKIKEIKHMHFGFRGEVSTGYNDEE